MSQALDDGEDSRLKKRRSSFDKLVNTLGTESEMASAVAVSTMHGEDKGAVGSKIKVTETLGVAKTEMTSQKGSRALWRRSCAIS